MVPQYKSRDSFDAQLVYQTWLKLVAEESLYDAMLEGRHAQVAKELGLSAEQVLILDDFGRQPGTRWHIENLRFRCATMVARTLKWHLPGTLLLLTGGSVDWLRDLAYEYMAHNRWQDFGHHQRAAECQRFARFVQERVMKRRPPPAYLETVLHYELAVLALQQSAGRRPVTDWPVPGTTDQPSDALQPRLSPGATLCALPVDLVGWLRRPEGPVHIEGPGPVHVLLWVPSAAELCQSMRLAASAHALVLACNGSKTVAELLHDAPERAAQLREWLAQGILTSSVPVETIAVR